jgi:hypothetical protein
MSTRHLITYGLIAAATPLLVLVNSLSRTAYQATDSKAKSLHPRLAEMPCLSAAAQNLAIAYRAWAAPSPARIVVENGQYFLEFYTPFHTLKQGPHLSLVLVTDILSTVDIKAQNSQSSLSKHNQPSSEPGYNLPISLGTLHTTAGQHRYPIPTGVNIRYYQTVAIRCAELNAIVGHVQLEQ